MRVGEEDEIEGEGGQVREGRDGRSEEGPNLGEQYSLILTAMSADAAERSHLRGHAGSTWPDLRRG